MIRKALQLQGELESTGRYLTSPAIAKMVPQQATKNVNTPRDGPCLTSETRQTALHGRLGVRIHDITHAALAR
jgi:hypothetical protein